MKQSRAALLVLVASLLVMAVIGVGAVTVWRPGNMMDVTSFGNRHDAAGSGLFSSWLTPEPSASPTPTLLSSPASIRIPTIDVNSPVRPVGVDENNAVEVPPDIFTIGWYRFGVPPGSAVGSAVLVGHRDGREQGHGAFYDLGALHRGDPVVVLTDSGERLTYRVVSRDAVPKLEFPKEAADLFAIDGRPRLTLISCGGYYDSSNGGYQDNIVVTAVPE